MAVPDTNTFSFWDVTQEVYGDHADGRNLISAFADAIAGKFDLTYGSKTSTNMLAFRNYGARTRAWRGIAPYCIQDGRPTGLTTFNFKYGIDYNGVYYYTIATELTAYDCGWKWYSGGVPRGLDCQMASLTVNQTVYLGTGIDTNVLDDGYYVLDIPVSGVDVYHVLNGIVTEIIPYYF